MLKTRWNAPVFALLALLAGASLVSAKNYALVIGIEGYENDSRFTRLNYAAEDAQQVGKFLQMCNFDVTVLNDASSLKPTKQNIVDALNTLVKNKSSGDLILVSLSGHGLSKPAPGNNITCYFAPINGKASDTSTLLEYDNEVFSVLKKCEAARKLLLVDACRDVDDSTDPMSPNFGNGVKRPDPEMYVPKVKKDYGLIALFSCSDRQFSYEDHEFKHGTFTYFALDALKARNTDAVTFGQVYNHVKQRVPDRVADKRQGKEQVPFVPGSNIDLYMKEEILRVPARGTAGVVNAAYSPIGDDQFEKQIVTNRTFTGTFTEINLRNTTFRNCRFVKCVFDRAQIYNTRFEDCDFIGTKFTGDYKDDESSLKTASFKGRSLVQGPTPWAGRDYPYDSPPQLTVDFKVDR